MFRFGIKTVIIQIQIKKIKETKAVYFQMQISGCEIFLVFRMQGGDGGGEGRGIHQEGGQEKGGCSHAQKTQNRGY